MDAVAHLDEYGFVVLANALSAQEAEHALSLLWDYLEELGTGIDRTDVGTWDDDRWPTAVHGAILPLWWLGTVRPSGISVISPRSNRPLPRSGIPMICSSVLTELPSGDLGLIRAIRVRTKAIAGCTLTSTRLAAIGKHCVQGLVNLLPTSESTGGNVVVPGSHKRFAQIPQEYEERLSRSLSEHRPF